MKNLRLILMALSLMVVSGNVLAKKVLKLPKKDCSVYGLTIQVFNSTSHHWVAGAKVKWRTNSGEGSLYGLSFTVNPGGYVMIPIIKTADKCKAKVILP